MWDGRIADLRDAVVKENKVAQLKASNNQSTNEVWEAVLRKGLLLGGEADGDFASEMEGLEVVATINKGNDMSLVLRRTIGELTVRGV